MSKKQILFSLGVLLFFLPFLGIGNYLKLVIVSVLGLFISLISFFLDDGSKKIRNNFADSFEDSRPKNMF